MLKKTLLITTMFAMVFCFSTIAFAETAEVVDEPEETVTDVTEEDLDIKGTSWFHNVWRNIQILVTSNPIKKSELRLRQASAQLLKAQQRLDKNPDSDKAEKWLDKANKKYDSLIEKINNKIIEAQEKNKDSERLNNFLDKYADHLLKHQEIMQKLETQVPEQAMEKIRTQREAHLQRFSETMMKLENKEQFGERLENALQNQAENQVKTNIRRVNTVKELKSRLRKLDNK